MKFIKVCPIRKYLLVSVLGLILVACSESQMRPAKSPTPEPPPTAEIDKAVREYLADKYVRTILGVTLHRQTDDYYVVGADYVSKDGKNDIWQLIVRRYDDQGRKYWKAEDLSMKLVDTLNGRADGDK